MTGVTYTIAYDADFVGNVMQGNPLPDDRWVQITLPVLVADGGASNALLRAVMDDQCLHHVGHQLLHLWDNRRFLRLPGEAVVIERGCPVE